MLTSHTQYSKSQLAHLNIKCNFNDTVPHLLSVSNWKQRQEIVLGAFKNVCDIIFNAKDGSLQFTPDMLINENSPDIVKRFATNFLFANIPEVTRAPDDETAFNLLIPRQYQTSAELAPYREKLVDIISTYRKSAQNGETNSATAQQSNS